MERRNDIRKERKMERRRREGREKEEIRKETRMQRRRREGRRE